MIWHEKESMLVSPDGWTAKATVSDYGMDPGVSHKVTPFRPLYLNSFGRNGQKHVF